MKLIRAKFAGICVSDKFNVLNRPTITGSCLIKMRLWPLCMSLQRERLCSNVRTISSMCLRYPSVDRVVEVEASSLIRARVFLNFAHLTFFWVHTTAAVDQPK